MKKILLILIILVSFKVLTAQENPDAKKNHFDLYLIAGYKTVVIDFISGPVFGLSIHNPDSPFSLNYRNDFLISSGKHTWADSAGIGHTFSDNYGNLRFISQSYLEAEYNLPYLKNHPVSIATGLTWTNLGDRENIKLNRDYGYMALSLSLKYKISWFAIELKADHPFLNDYFYVVGNYHPEPPLPVTIGLLYRFKPKKFE